MTFDDFQLTLVIPGKPLAQKRPKFRHVKTKSGKTFGMAYNPQETDAGKFMAQLDAALQRQNVNWKPLMGPVELDIVFAMPIPTTTSMRKAGLMEEGKIRHTKKPDLDNLVKFVKDCGSGILWQNDSQIDRIKASKEYSNTPETVINLRWPTDMNPEGRQP